MGNLVICKAVVCCTRHVCLGSCAVTCHVRRMVGVGRGVRKMFVFQEDCILPAYTEMIMLNFLHR